jgi:hypothetical protein
VTGPSSAHSIYTLSAEFAPGGASNYDQLTIHVLDQNGKPPPAAPVHLLVVGGVADAADVTTGPDGYVNVGITWQASHGGSVVVSSGDLKSITVRQPSL